MSVCACVRACVHACMRACVHACVCACVRACGLNEDDHNIYRSYCPKTPRCLF